ncbi:AAA family ATPase [Oceanobacillus timonensis]|uniref:AAA family ATPase n=1 Tax=Oceanobacillus timonensis TaxID=1926285 RepID=UPI0015C44126|nr:AAA family ATPase [Oceanobacillus timonensis]
MKIKEITIYGFGRWIDQSFSFSDSHLITLLGNNESGKTTLHQFMIYMLFGMTKKQCDFYRPKTSSKLGGRMIIEHPLEGTVRIERLDATEVRYFDNKGEEKDGTWFGALLGNVNAETFQSIYSFSDQDLTVMEEMNEEDMSELLLSVGLTGSAAIYKAEKKLQTELQKRFRPSGTKPVINEKLRELRSKDKQAEEKKQLEKSYKEQIEKLHTLENKHTLKKEQIAALDEQLEKKKLLDNTLPIRKEILHISEELQALTDVQDFPLDHQEQIRTIYADINQFDREIHSHQATLDTYTEKKQNVAINSLGSEEKEELTQLLNQKAEITFMMERRKTLEQDDNYKAREMTGMIQEKQINITTEELKQLELPFYLEKEWAAIRKEQEHLQESTADNQQQKEKLTQEKLRIQEEQKDVEKELLADVHVKELNQRMEAYQQRNHQDEKQQKGMYQLLEQMIRGKKKQQKMVTVTGIIVVLAVLLAGLIIDMPWLFLLSLAGGIGVYYIRRILEQHMTKLKQQQQDWQIDYSGQEMDVTAAEYAEAQEILEEQQRLHHKRSTLQDAFQQTIRELETTETLQSDLEKRQQRLEEKIAHQELQFPFLQSIAIFYWQDVYHLLQKLLQLSNEKQQIQIELDEVKEHLDQFFAQVKDWLEQNGFSSEPSLEAMMRTLEDIQQQEQQQQYEMQQLDQLIKDVQHKQLALKQKKHYYREEQDQLLKAAGAASEEDYFKKQERKEHFNKLFNRQEELTERMQMMLPEKWQQEWTEGSLEADQPYKNKKELELALAEEEEALEQLKNQLAEQKLRIEQLESAEDISLQMHELAMEKEELQDMVKAWAVQKTALRMLLAAKHQYKDKYLTLVIESAQTYFKEITGNQYDTIYAATAEKPFQVENSKNKQRFHVGELSKGTRDQLYISLRFAINEVMAKTSGLPFLMDDALVHFDRKRTERMQQVLERLSENQQVILFTCHREFAEAANGDIIQLHS